MIGFFGGFDDSEVFRRGEFDYIDTKVKYTTTNDLPGSFGGVSGGGLRAFTPITRNSGETFEIRTRALCGVAFYETEITKNQRSIRHHFIDSVYRSSTIQNQRLLNRRYQAIGRRRQLLFQDKQASSVCVYKKNRCGPHLLPQFLDEDKIVGGISLAFRSLGCATSNTQGGSRVRESPTLGSVRLAMIILYRDTQPPATARGLAMR